MTGENWPFHVPLEYRDSGKGRLLRRFAARDEHRRVHGEMPPGGQA